MIVGSTFWAAAVPANRIVLAAAAATTALAIVFMGFSSRKCEQ
jgi:hypothetical protein